MQSKAFEKHIISNYNAFFLGGSGSGKSFFTNYFVRNSYDNGDTIFIIDKGYSYEGLCSVIQEECVVVADDMLLECLGLHVDSYRYVPSPVA